MLKFDVIVSIPEDKQVKTGVRLKSDIRASGIHVPIGERLDGILGSCRSNRGTVTPQGVKEIWRAHLQEKHRGNK